MSPLRQNKVDELKTEEESLDRDIERIKELGKAFREIIKNIEGLPEKDEIVRLANNVIYESRAAKIGPGRDRFENFAKLQLAKMKDETAAAILQKAVAGFTVLFGPTYIDSYKRITDLDKQIQDIYQDTLLDITQKVFFRGGISAIGFRSQNEGSVSSDIDERFPKGNFTGWQGELGYNVQANRKKGRHYDYFGVSYRWRYMSNFDQLESRDFTLVREDSTFTGGKLTNSTSITALKEDIDIFHRHSLSIDYVRAIKIDSPTGGSTVSNLYLVLNPYLRHHMYVDAEKLEDHTVIGFGLHAYSVKKQRIMGGLFIQSNDFFGTNTDADKVFGERISVGLIARFTFSGFNLEEPKK